MDFEGINLPEGYTPSERVSGYADAGALAKGYDDLYAKHTNGSRIDVPGEGEDRTEFESKLREHLGIAPPESAEDYTWKAPEGFEDQFKDMGEDLKRYHEAGYDDKTVSFMMDEKANGIKQAAELLKETQTQVAKEAETALKEKWGDDYAENMKAVNKAAERFGGLTELLKTAGLANHQAVQEAMFEVAMSTREDKPPLNDKVDSKTLEARKAELKSSPAYLRANHADHASVMREIREIQASLSRVKN